MTDKVCAFENATLRYRDYLFFLVVWSDFNNRVTKALKEHIEQFGKELREKGAVILPSGDDTRATFIEIFQKPWPAELKERMQNDDYPFLLVIEQDFAAFDPEKHRSAIVWFSDYSEDPGDIWKIMARIARKVDAGADLFDYFEEVRERARRKGILAKVGRYLDLKLPVIPGFVSVNANAIWADATGALD